MIAPLRAWQRVLTLTGDCLQTVRRLNKNDTKFVDLSMSWLMMGDFGAELLADVLKVGIATPSNPRQLRGGRDHAAATDYAPRRSTRR